MIDFNGVLMVLVLYLCYRAGRWVERAEIERKQAETGACELADKYDQATQHKA
jgi:hypothetical protein